MIRTAEEMREAAISALHREASDCAMRGETFGLDDACDAIRALPIAPAPDREALMTLHVSARMARELRQWADEEREHWPPDTAYQDELTSLIAALEAAEALR